MVAPVTAANPVAADFVPIIRLPVVEDTETQAEIARERRERVEENAERLREERIASQERLEERRIEERRLDEQRLDTRLRDESIAEREERLAAEEARELAQAENVFTAQEDFEALDTPLPSVIRQELREYEYIQSGTALDVAENPLSVLV